MNWVSDTIREFGYSIGLPELAMDGRGRLELNLPDNAKLRITHLSDRSIQEVILSRGEICHYPSFDTMKKSLQLNDFRYSTNWPIQTGISDQRLWVSIRMPERSFVLNALEHGILEMKIQHEKFK